MNEYYVYAYISHSLPYYIGKGQKNRAYVNKHCVPVPKDKFRIVFLETNLTEIGALALERRYIRWYGRRDNNTGILLNRTDGGEGVSKGHIPYNKGKPWSEETKRKISESKRGTTISLRSPEHCKKISEHRKRYWAEKKENVS